MVFIIESRRLEKIYKIIDFGRAIYKYNGKQMCSDSFYPKGDAAGQFNFYGLKMKEKKGSIAK